jgi:malonyl-CoA O-methyltransferase
MFNKARIKQDFNRAAWHYDDHALLQRHVANGLFNILPELPPHSLILDAGAGTGYFQELARKNQQRWTVYQIDLAYNMCAIADKYASLPEYGLTYTVNSDIEQLPLANNCFDIVFSSLMLQWVMDIRQAFKEIHRVLAADGTCFISTLLPNTLHELSHSFEQSGFRSPISLFRDKEYIISLLKEAGFSQINTSRETLVLHYDNLIHLMRSLKGVGAQNKMTVKNNCFIGRSGLEKIGQHYASQFGSPLPGTWEILYISAKK